MTAPPRRRLRRALALGGLAVLLHLTGCAIRGRLPEPAADAFAPAGFSLEGRLAVRFGDESLAGGISWTHSAARDEVGLASPLGNRLALIVRDGTGVVLTGAGGAQVRADDAERLTEQTLGWRLPLSGLTDWVRARAAPVETAGAADGRRDNAQRWLRLNQSGWVIDFSYQDDAARLPRRLVLGFPAAQKPLEIRLVIDRWLTAE